MADEKLTGASGAIESVKANTIERIVERELRRMAELTFPTASRAAKAAWEIESFAHDAPASTRNFDFAALRRTLDRLWEPIEQLRLASALPGEPLLRLHPDRQSAL